MVKSKKTKIVCTLGPASADYKTIKALAEAGMNVARLNFSHGDYREKLEKIEIVRKVSQELKIPIAIMADMSGPKLRLGSFDGIREIKKGQQLVLSLNPINEEEIPIQFDLTPFVKKDQRIFLNDGLIELKVKSVRSKQIVGITQNDGVISSHKGVNIPDTHLKGMAFTEKDYHDCIWALAQEVDYIAVSFIQTADDLKKPKELIKKAKSKAKIVVKFEKKEAVDNMENIVSETDVIMVARGDLAIETPASEVPIIQQKLIKMCRQFHKPVIVATQMLESMTENPRPTRAETSDVGNAVLDQVDAVMLSAESASGKYPVEAVSTMNQIIYSVEAHPDYKHYIKINWDEMESEELSFSAIASAAASLAYRIQAKAIIVATASGRAARLISSFRPDVQIIAVTHDYQTNNQLSLIWGIKSLIVEPDESADKFWKNILDAVKKVDYVDPGDKVIMVSGSVIGLSGATDSIKVVTV